MWTPPLWKKHPGSNSWPSNSNTFITNNNINNSSRCNSSNSNLSINNSFIFNSSSTVVTPPSPNNSNSNSYTSNSKCNTIKSVHHSNNSRLQPPSYSNSNNSRFSRTRQLKLLPRKVLETLAVWGRWASANANSNSWQMWTTLGEIALKLRALLGKEEEVCRVTSAPWRRTSSLTCTIFKTHQLKRRMSRRKINSAARFQQLTSQLSFKPVETSCCSRQ